MGTKSNKSPSNTKSRKSIKSENVTKSSKSSKVSERMPNGQKKSSKATKSGKKRTRYLTENKTHSSYVQVYMLGRNVYPSKSPKSMNPPAYPSLRPSADPSLRPSAYS